MPSFDGASSDNGLATATATTPVVIVSADATPGQIERLLSEGATGYLTKPLDLPELLAVFNSAVDTTHASLA